MKIGIISDTHDNLENIEKAVKIFHENNIDLVLHACDFVNPESIRGFRGMKLIGVVGNNDTDKIGIGEAFDDIGGQLRGEIAEIEVDDMIFAIYHGTQRRKKERLIESGKYDVVISGHTHKVENTKVGKTIIINPGTARGWFFGYGATMAIFDTNTRETKIMEI